MVNIRYRLRLFFNALVALIPRRLLRGFFKTFTMRPEVAESAGFHVHPAGFDSPLPLMWEVDWEKLKHRRELRDIDFRLPEALQLLEKLARHAHELDAIPYAPVPGALFWFANGTLTDFDAAALHCLLRELKPRRYIELGCGWSSFISSHALARNAADGAPCEAIYSDPVPRRDLKELLVTGTVLQKRVQELPGEMFDQLQSGDVLFIDTSHVLKFQSDVEHELLSILPRLKSGVWIHFHDVFSPYDYPEDCLRHGSRLPWNEQYGLECLLLGGQRYQVELPLYLIWKDYREEIQPLLPRGSTRPQSFWLRKR
jgi:hypothetical protein